MQQRELMYSLLRQHAWNATAYQIVNPGMVHWFSPEGDAVVGYVRRGKVRVVAGAPVCPESRLESVLAEFGEWAKRSGGRVCYFGAAGRVHLVLSERSDYATVVLGAQPIWRPRDWPTPEELRPSLRAQLFRARNKGVVVREWSVNTAENHPELARVLAEWLARKPLPSMHFLVEPQTLAALMDKRIFVAEQASRPIGFVNLAPIPAREGWLTEQFVRGSHAPNGTVEAMLDMAMRTVAAEGAQYLTMGLVPLSSGSWDPKLYNPLWLRYVLGWTRAHGRRFYNFGGLERFKTKLGPSAWEPIFAISQETQFSFETLYAIASAFSDRSPPSTLARGAIKALRQEWHWLSNP